MNVTPCAIRPSVSPLHPHHYALLSLPRLRRVFFQDAERAAQENAKRSEELEAQARAAARSAAGVKAKEWRKPTTPHFVRTAKAPTCPLTPVFLTDKRASQRNNNSSGPPAGYTTPLAQVL